MDKPYLLEMSNISKSFPGVKANQNINLAIRSGEIHALLGENGAGKTTLMKILYGLYKPDAGEIRLKGSPLEITSPEQAIHRGIGMVHQHFMLIPPFTVLENIVLGNEPRKKFGMLDQAVALAKLNKLSLELGLKIDPHTKISDLSVGLQQRVEILKALYREAEILILDEPTSVLTPQESNDLGEILRKFVAQGKAVVFITHKLKEVKKFADTITIIRQGQVVNSVSCQETSVESLAEMMVGRKVLLEVEKKPAKLGENILKIENLNILDHRKLPKVRNFSLNVHAGEIIAVAGVDGNGQTELIEALTGLRPVNSGHIFLNNQEITNRTPRQIIESRLAHIPEDRQKRGLILDFSIWENLILEEYCTPEYSKLGFIKEKHAQTHALMLIKEFDIRTPHEKTATASLSGGNQQKIVLAREIRRNPQALIVAQPTRGLDVGAIEFIHQQLIVERDQGKAILLFSLELDEILTLADTIAVIYEGELMGMLPRTEANEETLGMMMTGSLRLKQKEASNS